jgi:hypothetical protein
LCEVPNRILDWDPCIACLQRRQQLLLSGTAASEVSIDWDPNPSPAVAKSLNILGPKYKRAPRQATAAVRDQQATSQY